MQIANIFNSRFIENSVKNIFLGILENKMFCVVVGFLVIAQILVVQFGSFVIGCTPLDLWDWLYCCKFAGFVLVWGFVTRLIPINGDYFSRQ